MKHGKLSFREAEEKAIEMLDLYLCHSQKKG